MQSVTFIFLLYITATALVTQKIMQSIRQKENICLVPVTRPYLFFSPDPKLFFHLNTKTFGPIFYSISRESREFKKHVFKAFMLTF